MAIVVEFAGLPAAGKTTLAAALATDLAGAGIPLLDPHPPTGRVHRWAGRARTLGRRAGALATGAGRLAADSRSLGHKAKALQWLAVTLDQVERAQRPAEGPGALVLAEGVVQRAMLVLLDVGRGRAAAAPDRYAARLPAPEVVVHLACTPQESVRRQLARRATATARAADRFDLAEAALERATVAADHVLAAVLAHLEARRGTTIVTLDATDLDTARDRLRRDVQPVVEELLGKGR